MAKSILRNFGLALICILLVQAVAQAEEKPPADASFKSQCANAAKLQFPPCANSPSECVSGPKPFLVGDKEIYRTPFNCMFLQEPIGGKTGYDLFKLSPKGQYTLWYGEAIVEPDVGPLQALLAYEAGKELQGPFGLLYSYLGLVYNWLSGIIIAFVILVAIIGGVRMTVSAGNQTEFQAGRDMIVKALLGMVVWFTASVILYTINPTFFAF